MSGGCFACTPRAQGFLLWRILLGVLKGQQRFKPTSQQLFLAPILQTSHQKQRVILVRRDCSDNFAQYNVK